MKKALVPILWFVAVVSLIGNFLLYKRYSTSRPVVTFAGDQITKKEYMDALEYQAGKPVLNKLVFAKMVMDAAKQQGVSPTDAEVDERIAEIKRRNPALLQPLGQDAFKMAQFRSDMKANIALENLQIKGVTVTPDEARAFYRKYPQLFVLPQQIQTTMVVSQNAVNAATAESLLKQNYPDDAIARTQGLNVVGVNGYQVNMDVLPPADKTRVSRTLMGMKSGEVKTLHIQNVYVTFRVKKADQTQVPPFSAVQDKAERLARLAKAPKSQVILAQIFKADKPDFGGEKYGSYFSDINAYSEQVASSVGGVKSH